MSSSITLVAPDQQELDEWLAGGPGADELASLAMSRPAVVLAWTGPDRPGADLERLAEVFGESRLWQARGLAARETGDARTALGYLRRAVSSADRGDDPDRSADTRASLAATLMVAGRSAAALRALDDAERLAGPAVRAQVQVRQAAVLDMVGRRPEALDVLALAVPALHRSGDVLWEARARTNRALVQLQLGRAASARRDLNRAAQLFAMTDQAYETAACVNNLGWASYRAGSLPRALAELAEADELYRRAGTHPPSLAIDRCAVLLASGLVEEAFAQGEEGVARYGSGSAEDDRAEPRAEALLVASRAGLAAGHPQRAAEHASSAIAVFERLGNRRAVAVAKLELLRADFRRLDAAPHASSGRSFAGLASRAGRIVAELEQVGVPELPDALLLAGRISQAAGRPVEAVRYWTLGARSRDRFGAGALGRVAAWHSRALARDVAGSHAGVLRAADAGLRVLERDRHALAATELRAHATRHGTELGSLALANVVASADARRLLVWSERLRATIFDFDATRAPRDEQLLDLLGELRQVSREAGATGPDESGPEAAGRRRAQLERAIRERARQVSGPASADALPAAWKLDLDALLAELDGAVLLSLVDVGGMLHGVEVEGRRVRSMPIGPMAGAVRELEFTRFALRSSLVTGRPTSSAPGAQSPDRLQAAAAGLERALLGPFAERRSDAPLVVVPPTRLHAAPWGVIPALAGRPVSVAPSARSWLRARSARPRGQAVVLVRGPRLPSAAAEIDELSRMHPQATVLVGRDASVERTLSAFDGAWLAHVAAHGSFRGEAAMFSSLELDDGSLTVHDLEVLRRPPHRLVLSACDVGLGQAVGVDELLGVVTALMSVGSAGVLASVLPVPDTGAAELSVIVHERLLAGDDLPHALLHVRTSEVSSPRAASTAGAFVAFGAR